jgi:hypothetical protein
LRIHKRAHEREHLYAGGELLGAKPEKIEEAKEKVDSAVNELL